MLPGLLAGLTLTLVLAAGIGGLGRLVGLRELPAAWVVGFHMVWWPAALAGTLLGPRAGAVTALALPAAGLVGWIPGGPDRRTSLGLLAALVVGAPVWLAPPFFYDSLVYHLGMPWTWLSNGTMAPVPHNLFSHFPLAASVVFLGPVALGVPSAAAGLHWAAMVLTVAAAVALARRLGAGRWAWIAAVCTLATWHGPWMAGLAAADWFGLLGVTVAASEIAGLLGAGEAGRPWVAGLGLGLALAVKYTAAVPVAAVLLALVLVEPRRWRAALTAGTVAVLACSFWLVRNVVTTGNPVYPLLWRFLGGRGWSESLDARYLQAVRPGVGGISEAALGIGRLFDPVHGLGPWLWIAVPVALAFILLPGRRRPAALWVGASAVLMALGWAFTAQLPRFALAMGPLLGAAAAACLGVCLSRTSARPVAVTLAGAGLWGVFLYGQFLVGTLDWPSWWRGPERWRHAVTVNDPLPAYRAADRLLPADARILLVGEARSWGCPRPHHASSARDEQLVQVVVGSSETAGEAARRLDAMGFTHLLVNHGEIRRLHGPPALLMAWPDAASEARWWSFWNRWTGPVWNGGEVEIRALAGPGAGMTGAVSGSPKESTMRAGKGGDHDRANP